tara:strand:+ start:9418 stop:10794 length:1377 start_codon:yes stop_codon:yes gene_type:complete
MLKHNILVAIGFISISGLAATDSAFVQLDSIPNARITEVITDTNRLHDQVAPVLIPSTASAYFSQLESGESYVKMQIRSFNSDNNAEYSIPFVVKNTNSVVGVSTNQDTIYLTGSTDDRISFQQGLIQVHRASIGWSEPQVIKVKGFKPTSWSYGMYMHPDGDLLLIYQKKGITSNFEMFISKRESDTEFGKPMRLESICTDADEITPYLSNDKKRLYFSSNATDKNQADDANFDLWMCEVKNADFTEFSTPVKLPLGVNKSNSYESYAIEIDSANIIFSSDRGGKGMRLYRAALENNPVVKEIPEEIPVIALEEEPEEAITPDTLEAPTPVVIPKAVTTKTVRMSSDKIKFELNKSKLTAQSLEYLKEYFPPTSENFDKTKSISIFGYTDSSGSASYNLSLSHKRSESVKQALISMGWDEAIINANGKGEENPIADNNTLEGRQKNRRVEFEVEQIQ